VWCLRLNLKGRRRSRQRRPAWKTAVQREAELVLTGAALRVSVDHVAARGPRLPSSPTLRVRLRTCAPRSCASEMATAVELESFSFRLGRPVIVFVGMANRCSLLGPICSQCVGSLGTWIDMDVFARHAVMTCHRGENKRITVRLASPGCPCPQSINWLNPESIWMVVNSTDPTRIGRKTAVFDLIYCRRVTVPSRLR
jgi:hypothetical protein